MVKNGLKMESDGRSPRLESMTQFLLQENDIETIEKKR